MREGRALQDLYTILHDVVHRVEKDLKRQNVNLKLRTPGTVTLGAENEIRTNSMMHANSFGVLRLDA